MSKGEYNGIKEEFKYPENAVEINKCYMKKCYMKTMKTYCVSCQKNTANKNSSFRKTKQNRLMLVSNFTICGLKKSRFLLNSRNE